MEAVTGADREVGTDLSYAVQARARLCTTGLFNPDHSWTAATIAQDFGLTVDVLPSIILAVFQWAGASLRLRKTGSGAGG